MSEFHELPLCGGVIVFVAVLATGGAVALRLRRVTTPPAFAATRGEGDASAAARATLAALPFEAISDQKRNFVTRAQ